MIKHLALIAACAWLALCIGQGKLGAGHIRPATTPHGTSPKMSVPRPTHNSQRIQAPCVVALDLHGVLMTLNKWEAVPAGLRHLCPGIRTFFNTRHEYPDIKSALKDAFAPAANCQNPVHEMWDLVRKLKAQGIPVILFSNIVPRTFEDISVRYADLLELFDVCITAGPHGDQWLNKDSDAFYALCEIRAQNITGGTPIIIYVDDTQACIDRARSRGWKALKHATPGDTVAFIENSIAELTRPNAR